MPHQTYEGDICGGLSGRYGGGFPGFGNPFGLGNCGFGRWLVAGGLGLTAIGGTAFAATSDGAWSSYEELGYNARYEYNYDYQTPDLPDGFELELPR